MSKDIGIYIDIDIDINLRNHFISHSNLLLIDFVIFILGFG